MKQRLSCCVPHCRRTTAEECREWICGKHWPLVPRALRGEWSRAKRRARRIVARKPEYREWWTLKAGSSDRLAAVALWRRLDSIWDRCKVAAIEKAVGI